MPVSQPHSRLSVYCFLTQYSQVSRLLYWLVRWIIMSSTKKINQSQNQNWLKWNCTRAAVLDTSVETTNKHQVICVNFLVLVGTWIWEHGSQDSCLKSWENSNQRIKNEPDAWESRRKRQRWRPKEGSNVKASDGKRSYKESRKQ